MELLKNLCISSGVSGFEAQIKETIINEIKDYAEIKILPSGDLVAFVSGESREKTVCFFAPLDENGFLISGFDENGNARLTAVGKTAPESLFGKKVSANGKIGVISQIPVHLSSEEDKKRLLKTEELSVDFGFENLRSAEKELCEGAPVCFAPAFFKEGNKIFAKSVETRASVYALIEIIKKKPKYNTFFVFAVCEKTGFSGSKTAAFYLKPDIAVYLDFACAENELKLGGGTALTRFTQTAFSDAELFVKAKEAFEEEKIPYQLLLQKGDANGAGEIAASNGGAAVLTLSLPVKNANTPLGIADENDISSLIKAIEALNERI